MELALAPQPQSIRYKFQPQTRVAISAPSILLVEDHTDSAHLHLLRLMGCKVDVATSGQQAIALSSHPYDLILLDIHLPDLCGFKVSKTIKELHHPVRVPIIALTTNTKAAKQIGIDELVAKPVPPEQLISILTRWL